MGPIAPDEPAAKGPVAYCLDALSSRPGARDRLGALRQGILDISGSEFRGLEEVFARYLFPPFYNADQITRLTEYLRVNWFNEATGWWPSFQPIAPIYALGLLQSIRACLSVVGDPLAFDTYWILDHTHVELISLVSSRQVTLLIATPPPPEAGPSGTLGEFAEMWVTSRRAGKTDEEVNPATGQQVAGGGTELRVRTYKLRTRPRRPS